MYSLALQKNAQTFQELDNLKTQVVCVTITYLILCNFYV